MNSAALWISGATFFSSLFLFCQKFLKIQSISNDGLVKEISLRFASSVHSLLTTVCAVVIIRQCQNDIMYSKSYIVEPYMWFGHPYFLYDTAAMWITYKANNLERNTRGSLKLRFIRQKWLFIVHHIFVAFILFPLIMFYRTGIGDWFVGIFFLTEASTPFVSFRAVLSKVNRKDTKIYKINGVAMLVTFFCCRILIFPFLYQSYANYASISVLSVPLSIPIKCNISCLAILCLQIYWFSVMSRGALKLLKELNHEKD